MHRCSYGAPDRVWFKTNNGWASRDWLPGERAAYERDVLHRD
jgi:hypothetical protein